jgi:hypothetical protein
MSAAAKRINGCAPVFSRSGPAVHHMMVMCGRRKAALFAAAPNQL